MFRHPKYYKELRKLRNKSDQAISSGTASTDDAGVRPGPGPKLGEMDIASSKQLGEMDIASSKQQASSIKQQAIEETVPHNDIEEATSSQASSDKHQAPSTKVQA